jgi:DNA replicative helicase MCM subunit Mcm2 (Cdc46/Mcm family)
MGKGTGKVVEISTLIITVTSLSITALGAFFVYRQTSLTFVKGERDDYRRKCNECEQSMQGLMRENRWLINRLSQYEDPGQRWRPQRSSGEDPEKTGGGE